jgi:hypothetical protein
MQMEFLRRSTLENGGLEQSFQKWALQPTKGPWSFFQGQPKVLMVQLGTIIIIIILNC